MQAAKITIKDFKYNYNKFYSDTTMSLSKTKTGIFIYNARFNQTVDYDSLTVKLSLYLIRMLYNIFPIDFYLFGIPNQ